MEEKIFNRSVCFSFFESYLDQAKQVKEQLDRAERNQQSISAGVATVEERTEIIQQQASDITESTKRAEQHLYDAENQNARAGELIDECQQILAGAGKRVQARKETH